MSSTDSWSKRPHFSIEGIEVAPAAGLEVAFDKSPEVFSNPWTEKKNRSVPFWKCRKINWRRKAFGVPLLWTVIGITAFVVGIATGGIIASAIASKERPLRAGSSPQSPSNSNPTASSPVGSLMMQPSATSASQPSSPTASSISITLATSASLNAAQTSLPSFSTSTFSGGVDSATNFQIFTGALGGIPAPPVTATGDSIRPFEVSGVTFTGLAAAITHSCNNQYSSCADVANDLEKGSVTIAQCDTQQTQCLASSSLTTTQSAVLAMAT